MFLVKQVVPQAKGRLFLPPHLTSLTVTLVTLPKEMQYAMDYDTVQLINKRQYTGTWDPSSRIIYSDAWGSGSGQKTQAEVTEASASRIGAQVRSAVSGIKVIMDGVAVGHLVAPTVSQDIARETAVP